MVTTSVKRAGLPAADALLLGLVAIIGAGACVGVLGCSGSGGGSGGGSIVAADELPGATTSDVGSADTAVCVRTTEICNGVDDDCDGEVDGVACDDGDTCTKGDLCVDGVCAGSLVDPFCCRAPGDCPEDDDLCDGVFACDQEAEDPADWRCREDPASVVTCEASEDPCHEMVCEPATGRCEPVELLADGSPCAEGDECTQRVCNEGRCAGVDSLICDDGMICTADSCDPEAGCLFVPIAGRCDDGDACVAPSLCVDGRCSPGEITDCDDDNVCTADRCDPAAGCVHTELPGCEEEDLCGPEWATDCDDYDACTTDQCDPAVGCVHTSLVECEDGDPCTVGETCTGGFCRGGTLVDCRDGDPCTLDLGCGEDGECVRLPLKAPGCPGECTPELELTAVLAPEAPFRGRVEESAVQDGYVYAITPAGLAVYELGVSGVIDRVGGTPFNGTLASLLVAGERALVSPWNTDRVLDIDLSDPTNPAIAREMSGFAKVSRVSSGAVHGDWLYVPSLAGLHAAPLEGLHRLEEVEPVLAWDGLHGALRAHDGLLYWSAEGELRVLSVTEPGAPAFVAAAEAEGRGMPNVSVSDGVVLTSNWSGSVRVFDVADPRLPELKAELDLSRVDGMTMTGRGAWLTQGVLGLVRLDVSEPTAPIVTASQKLVHADSTGEQKTLWTQSIAYDAPYTFVGTDRGLLVADLTSDANVQHLDSTLSTAEASEVAVAGSVAHLADYEAGYRVFDVRSASPPVQLSRRQLPSNVRSLAADGFLTYVVTRSGHLHVFDTSRPRAPLRISEPKQVGRIRLAGARGRLLVGFRHQHLRLFDVTDPRDPAGLAHFQVPSGGVRHAVVGNDVLFANAFSATGSSMYVVDISDPRDPRIIHTASRGDADSMALHGSTLYVEDSRPGGEAGYPPPDHLIVAYDVADPAHPVKLWEIETWTSLQGLAAQGDVLYTTSWFGDLYAYQLRPAQAPRELGGPVPGCGHGKGLEARNARAFAPSGAVILNIVDLRCEE